MADSYFTALDETTAGGRYRPDAATGGPWGPGAQHGGPPNALLVRAAERCASAADRSPELGPMLAMRTAAEFLAPVPVAELSVRAEIVRAGRNVTLVAVSLAGAADKPCLQARVWLARARDTSEVAPAPATPGAPPAGPTSQFLSFPYAQTIDWSADRGSLTDSGPAAVWARPRWTLLDGEALSGLQRVALVGDSASGLSAELPWGEWDFPNVDLDIHLARPLRGEWVHLDASSQLGDAGVALARSTVSDLHGRVGATMQTLVLARR